MEREQEDGAQTDRGNDRGGKCNHKKVHGTLSGVTNAEHVGLPGELKAL
jgi:hypothetical protein